MKFDPETQQYTGADGLKYETEWEAQYFGQLCMCGCGLPEESYNLLREMLKQCDRRSNRNNPRDWVDGDKAIAKLVVANPELTAQILMHFLTDKNVLEHGGIVARSWLTPAGEEIVDGAPAPTD